MKSWSEETCHDGTDSAEMPRERMGVSVLDVERAEVTFVVAERGRVVWRTRTRTG